MQSCLGYEKQPFLVQNGTINRAYLYTRGSAHWACVAHLSFCFEET
jgi:hypothetical protein